ncbi:septum formation initiator family protein [Streptomyces sp. NPDC047017]|uniref:septum formation initiator family protein n=1 Tax=Streptomyces sp. NPDC047017 TaxID=3155024 RepID=UPI00340122BF
MSRTPELKGRAARLARLLPGRGRQAARAPFVLLVVLLLGGGLIGLLVLNSALSEGAFQRDDLQKDTKSLTDEEQALQHDIDAYSAPDALERRARRLGMVPGGDPAFLNPDGTVKGVPSAAAEQSLYTDLPVSVRPPEFLTSAPSPADGTAPTGVPGTADGFGTADGAAPAAGSTDVPGAPQTAPTTAPQGAGQDAAPTGPAALTAPGTATTPTPGR